jgi:hypothetical protein
MTDRCGDLAQHVTDHVTQVRVIRCAHRALSWSRPPEHQQPPTGAEAELVGRVPETNIGVSACDRSWRLTSRPS